MIRGYFEAAKKNFKTHLAYRMDYFAGVINTTLLIFVNIAIWKAIFEEDEVIGGIHFQVLATYFVLSFLMQSLFSLDDFLVERKIQTGSISMDLLKPMGFNLYIFAQHLGTLFFRLLMQVLPALIIASFLFKILPPFSLLMALCFVLSLTLGFLVLYNLNYLVWMSSFWFHFTFSVITFKDAALMVLSGAFLPLWFMPDWLVKIISFTPFDSIFFIPISIYLGQVSEDVILFSIGKQLLWIFLLFLAGRLMWRGAKRILIVQGG